MDDTWRGNPDQPVAQSPRASGNIPPMSARLPETRTVPAGDKALALRARDRVLLYTRGMELEPLPGVELALESLRRAAGGKEPGYPPEHPLDVAGAMRALRAVLAEHGLSPEVEAPGGGRLVSSPPIRRSPLAPAADTWFRRDPVHGRSRKDGL